MDSLVLVKTRGEYKAKEIKYYQRILLCFRVTWFFYLLIFFVMGMASSFKYSICIVFFLFLINIIEYRNWSKYYILEIKRKNNSLYVKYNFKNEVKTIEDTHFSFKFIKKQVWYKIRGNTTYLLVKHNDVEIAKQFTLKDINEVVFDFLIKDL